MVWGRWSQRFLTKWTAFPLSSPYALLFEQISFLMHQRGSEPFPQIPCDLVAGTLGAADVALLPGGVRDLGDGSATLLRG
jgi:hypothetical protein